MKFNLKFRSLFAEKVMDLGNFTLVALTIGQLVGGVNFSATNFSLGIVIWITCYFVSYLLNL